MASKGIGTSEYKVARTNTIVGGSAAIVSIAALLFSKDGLLATGEVSWPMAAIAIVLIMCVTSVQIAYIISRGVYKASASREDSEPVSQVVQDDQ